MHRVAPRTGPDEVEFRGKRRCGTIYVLYARGFRTPSPKWRAPSVRVWTGYRRSTPATPRTALQGGIAASVAAVAHRATGDSGRGQLLGGRVVRSSSVRMNGAGRVGWLAAPSTRTAPSKVTTPVAVASRCLRVLVLIRKP